MFLRARRERTAPHQVGLPELGRRRTPGLRREEVAELAGISTTWHVSETGSAGPGLGGGPARDRRRPAPRRGRAVPSRGARGAPGRWHRPNRTGRVPLGRSVPGAGTARAQSRLHHRLESGPAGLLLRRWHPKSARFTDLVGELRDRSPEADAWWPRYDIATNAAGTKRVRRHDGREVALTYASFQVAEHPELVPPSITRPESSARPGCLSNRAAPAICWVRCSRSSPYLRRRPAQPRQRAPAASVAVGSTGRSAPSDAVSGGGWRRAAPVRRRREVAAQRVFGLRGYRVIPLGQRSRGFRERDPLAAEHCDCGGHRRGVIHGQSCPGGVSLSPIRQKRRADRAGSPTRVSVASSRSRSNAGEPSGLMLLQATIFSPIQAARPAGLSVRPTSRVARFVACWCA